MVSDKGILNIKCLEIQIHHNEKNTKELYEQMQVR